MQPFKYPVYVLMIMIPEVATGKAITQLSTESGINYMQNKCL